MKKISMAAAMLCFLLSCGYAEQDKNAPPAAKKEHVFKGKVEKIDLANKTFTVNGQKVEGWMDAMTMNYVPDKEDVLKKVKVGDEISAKVYDGDFRTLHDVQIVSASKPAETKAAPAGKTENKASKAGKK
jgi:Cu/Ag efflux protein CusF